MQKRLALLAICLGYFVTILDVTVVNVALASVQHDLAASVNGVQWIVVGYTLAFASLLLSGGTLGERFGNRRMYLIGLAGFTLFSLLCGLAPNLLGLQIFRIAQGMCAALLVPVSLGLIPELFPDSHARAKAIGIWGGVAGIGAAAGPILGGLLVSTLGWRSIFLLNIPVGILALFLTVRYMHPAEKQHPAKLDIAGQLTSVIGLGALTFILLQVNMLGLISPLTIVAVVITILGLGAFLIIERSGQNPMVPLGFFKNASFSAANLVGFFTNFAVYGWLFVISLYFQHIHHLSPLLTGLAILPWGVAVFVSSTLSGRVTANNGPRAPMLIGLSVGTLAYLTQLFLSPSLAYAWMVIPFIALGFGIAFVMPAMTVAVMGHSPKERSSTASGIVNAARQLGACFGVAILGSLIGGSNFVSGLQLGMGICMGVYALALLVTARWLRNPA